MSRTVKNYNRCRAGFVAQGTSLWRWAEAQGHSPQAVKRALLGQSRSPAADALAKAAMAAAYKTDADR